MSRFRIKKGVAVIADGNSGWLILDETGRKKTVSPLASELIGLIRRGPGDEDGLVAALEDRFGPAHVYYALNRLEKEGVIVGGQEVPEAPADLFRAKVCGGEGTGYPRPSASVTAVRVLSVGEAHSSADAIAGSLTRSDLLAVRRVESASMEGWAEGADGGALYVVVTPDYLEPEMEAFGRIAHERGLRWLPVKPQGMIPWMGPLFIPGETGCIACLLDRVRGHRRLEAKQIRAHGGKRSLGLSVAQTAHSFEAAAGLLAVELEKLATGAVPEAEGAVVTLDFRTLELRKHPFTRRPQCPVCGTLTLGGGGRDGSADGSVPEDPLPLRSRLKSDYRDGGERACSAVETLEKYAHLVSPVTGVVGRLATIEGIPPCFGTLVTSDWNVRDGGEAGRDGRNGRLTALGISTGKGRTTAQARASALGEAVERYSSQHEGYEPRIRASLHGLGDTAIHPYDLMGFSERQYGDRETWRRKGETAYVPEPYDPKRPIDWTPAWSLTRRRWRLVPSAFVYYSYPREGGGDICRGCSNGVAAGNCLEEAVMQGFFELVERDAVAMWWYHRLRKPAVDWQSFGSPFAAAVDAAMDGMGMSLAVLDLTGDLGIPVFSANLFDRSRDCRFKSIGLGCHRDPRIALERALAELGQALGRADRDEESLRFQDSPHSREPFLRADPRQAPRAISDFAGGAGDDFLDDIEDMVRLLRTRGLEMLVVDLTRPDVGFPVCRVIVPGLAHFWPRFGCRRLFEVPEAAGWIRAGTGEDDLNPVPFFL